MYIPVLTAEPRDPKPPTNQLEPLELNELNKWNRTLTPIKFPKNEPVDNNIKNHKDDDIFLNRKLLERRKLEIIGLTESNGYDLMQLKIFELILRTCPRMPGKC